MMNIFTAFSKWRRGSKGSWLITCSQDQDQFMVCGYLWGTFLWHSPHGDCVVAKRSTATLRPVSGETLSHWSLTMLYQRLCVSHEPRGVCPSGSEMFDHGEHVDNVFLAERRPVSGLEHVLPQLDLKQNKKDKAPPCNLPRAAAGDQYKFC